MSRLFVTCLVLVGAFVHMAFGMDARPDAVVAADGTAQFKTIQEAINAAPQNTNSTNWWVIHVRPGTYHELVYIQREKRFVRLVGEDPVRTVITYGLHANMSGPDGRSLGTFRTPTVCVDADDFVAEGITFENSAGPVGQALAIRVDGDRVVFGRCRFLGWQDTVFLNRGRQYFRDCYIAGHVDFIFGGATAWFERCEVFARGRGYITAASTPREQPFGFVFHRCVIRGETNVLTYLGRPWRDFAAVTFINCEMSEVVRPEGWHNWGRPEREKTVRYAEFGSTGPGGVAAGRVTWAKQLTGDEAAQITVRVVLAGADGWDPERYLAVAGNAEK